ncbi:hypothetical protein [Streptomyces atratus]|uniref:hypothetical protein n=1 Tax=Streptomyces atratus TaxID=1893 RepID=UPI002259DBF5|nr:hypothetical protein [Streptomyces atratus]MCX5338689.1 hypothetical protein [Streptomyces atratus]
MSPCRRRWTPSTIPLIGADKTTAAGTSGTGTPKQGVAPGAKISAIQVFSRFDSTDYCGSATPCALSFTSDQLAALEKVDAYKQAGGPSSPPT